MLHGGATGSVINRNVNFGSPVNTNNNRTFYRKDKKKGGQDLLKTLHPTLRRGTDMTKSQINEMGSTEVQPTANEIMTPHNHRNGVIANEYSNNGWPLNS